MTPELMPETSIAAIRQRIDERQGTVGFVPTMGALHRGHARLIDSARAECQTVIVSIFVNALQFDREDDLRGYPRTLEHDLQLCAAHSVDLVFAPSASEVYPRPPLCRVDVGSLADHLCGRFRPGHFGGVATVVLKLLEIVRPARAYFGEKDAQQLAIIRRLVEDFNVSTTIVGIPTVRDADGLAMSSRNLHLSASERALAPALYQALCEAQRLIAAGADDPTTIIAAATTRIPSGPDLRVEYFEIVDPSTLQPVSALRQPVLAAGAVWVGATRLIDNLICTLPE